MLHKLALASNPTLAARADCACAEEKVATAVELGVRAYLANHQLKEAGRFPYVQDSANIPSPPKQPRVAAPGPGVKGIPKVTPGAGKGMGAPTPASPSQGGGGSSVTSSSKTAEDNALTTLLAGGLGGLGGWAAGKKYLQPAANRPIAALEERLRRLRKVTDNVPIGAAAVGAILLAALAASRARKQEREALQGPPPQLRNYDPTNSGYRQNEQSDWMSNQNIDPRAFY